MGLPTFVRHLCGAAWTGSGTPGMTSAVTSGPIDPGQSLVVMVYGLFEDAPFYQPLVIAPSYSLFSFVLESNCGPLRGFVEQLGGTLAAGSTIQVYDAWAWDAFCVDLIAPGLGLTDYEFRFAISYADGRHPGSGVVDAETRLVDPRYAETLLMGAIGWTGPNLSGKVTAPVLDVERIAYDSNTPGTQYGLATWHRDVTGCGFQSEPFSLDDPDGPARYWTMALYFRGDTSAPCPLSSDGSTGIALPTYSDVAPTGPACPIGYNQEPYGPSPVTCVPIPMWWDVDFTYLPDGTRLVACLPNVPGDFGALWIVRCDDAYPPNAGTPQVVVASGVHSCALATTNDGLVHLFYRRNATGHLLYYRFSRDLGRTWGSEQTLDPGFAPFEITDPAGTAVRNGGFFSHSISVAVLPSGLAVVPLYDGPGTFVPLYTGVLARNASGGWDLSGVSSGGTGPLHMQVLRDGSIAVSLRRTFNVQADGSKESVLLPTVGPTGSSGLTRAVWIDEVAGVMLSIGQKTNAHSALGWSVVVEKPGGWAVVGTSDSTNFAEPTYSYPVPVPVWPLAENALGTRILGISAALPACALRGRPDGGWELLSCNLAGDLRFLRASYMPNSGGVVWEGSR